jgi:hypothetical protein
LRALERKVRKAKTRAAAVIDPKARKPHEATVRALQAQIREHVKAYEHLGLRRKPERERIDLGHTPRAAAATPASPSPAGEAADPALKLTVKRLKEIAQAATIPLFGATRKTEILARLRDWEDVRKVKISGLPEWKPPKPRPPGEPEPPPLGVPSPSSPVLSGAVGTHWWKKLHRLIGSDADTPPEGFRISDVQIEPSGAGYSEYVAQAGTVWRIDGVAYLIEHDPDDFGEPWVSRALAELRTAHDSIPAAAEANKAYAVLTGRNPADKYWTQRYNRPDFLSDAVAGQGHIDLWNFQPGLSRVGNKIETLRHETGHNVDERAGRKTAGSQSPAWAKAAPADYQVASRIIGLKPTHTRARKLAEHEPGRGWPYGVTDYGRSSELEDYAESVMLYQLGPIATGRLSDEPAARALYFRDIYPRRAAILDQIPELREVAERHKAEIAALLAPPTVPPEKAPVPDDLTKLTVLQLRTLAVARGVRVTGGLSRARKAELVEALRAAGKPEPKRETGREDEDLTKLTVPQLRVLAATRGVRIPGKPLSRARKPELLEVIGRAGGARPTPPTGVLKVDVFSRDAKHPGISDDEFGALLRYGGGRFRQLNRDLRDGKEDPDVALIDAVMRRSRTDAGVTVYRGLPTGTEIFGPRENWPEDLSGFEWTELAYSSTARDESTAVNFARTRTVHTPGLLLRIHVPQNVGAVDLEGGLMETELLLERGLRYRVVGEGVARRVNMRGETARVLDVEIVPTSSTRQAEAEAIPTQLAKFHRQLDSGQRRILDTIRSEPKPKERQLGGESARTYLLTYPDGTKLIRKTYSRMGEAAREVTRQNDAEQLAPLVLRAVGLRAPAVVRTGQNEIHMEWLDGQLGDDIVPWGDDVGPAILNSDPGRLLGLADALLMNNDRNEGNWLRLDDGTLAGIDHGYAFTRDNLSANKFVRHFRPTTWTVKAGARSRWVLNDMSPADMATIRGRLERLRPDFEHVGRLAWWQAMMARLDILTRKASGTRSRLPDVSAAEAAPAAAERKRATTTRATSPTIRPELEAARTAGAVTNVLRTEVGRITGRSTAQTYISLHGMSAATAREVAEGILRGLERFPDADLREIRVAGRLTNNPYAVADPYRRSIEFSSDRTSPAGRAASLRSLANDVAGWDEPGGVGWHPRGTGNWTAIAIHELGHNIDIATLAKAIHPEVDTLLGRRVDETRDEIDRFAASAYMGRDDLTADELIRREVSEYATKNRKELVAEAFADVMVNGAEAGRLSREIFRLLEAEYRRTRRKETR